MTHSVASNAFAQAEYLYEANRDLKTRVRNQHLDGSQWEDISRYVYRYDALARRTDVVNTGSEFQNDALSLWDYNDRSEVIAQNRHLGTDPQNPGTAIPAEDFAYAYDPIGNRLNSQAGTDPQRTYTTNVLNQYSAISAGSAVNPVHDKDGNLIESGDGWFYKWNGNNRLIEARNFDIVAVNGSVRLTFIYDYMGRRVTKLVEEYNGSTWITQDERSFVYQGWNLILEIDDNQDILKGYLWGMDLSGTAQGAGGVGGLLAMVDVQENIAAAAFYDANGNLTQLYDWINEEVIAHYEYNPFGGITNQSGTYADANTFRFSTKYLDVETGFYYYGYRYYDPETGRWPSRDPIEEQGGVNLYGFVGNDPLNTWDLFGLFSQSWANRMHGQYVTQQHYQYVVAPDQQLEIFEATVEDFNKYIEIIVEKALDKAVEKILPEVPSKIFSIWGWVTITPKHDMSIRNHCTLTGQRLVCDLRTKKIIKHCYYLCYSTQHQSIVMEWDEYRRVAPMEPCPSF